MGTSCWWGPEGSRASLPVGGVCACRGPMDTAGLRSRPPVARCASRSTRLTRNGPGRLAERHQRLPLFGRSRNGSLARSRGNDDAGAEPHRDGRVPRPIERPQPVLRRSLLARPSPKPPDHERRQQAQQHARDHRRHLRGSPAAPAPHGLGVDEDALARWAAPRPRAPPELLHGRPVLRAMQRRPCPVRHNLSSLNSVASGEHQRFGYASRMRRTTSWNTAISSGRASCFRRF
jgi:hypothetical protein